MKAEREELLLAIVVHMYKGTMKELPYTVKPYQANVNGGSKGAVLGLDTKIVNILAYNEALNLLQQVAFSARDVDALELLKKNDCNTMLISESRRSILLAKVVPLAASLFAAYDFR